MKRGKKTSKKAAKRTKRTTPGESAFEADNDLAIEREKQDRLDNFALISSRHVRKLVGLVDSIFDRYLDEPTELTYPQQLQVMNRVLAYQHIRLTEAVAMVAVTKMARAVQEAEAAEPVKKEDT